MRLDKFLSVTATATRSEASKAAKAGAVTVNGAVVKKCDLHIDPERDVICFRGEPVIYRRFTYIMLNKPDGYVSATDDPRERRCSSCSQKTWRGWDFSPREDWTRTPSVFFY